MSSFLIKQAVRTLFLLTGRDKAGAQARGFLKDYLVLADRMNEESGSKAVRVPPMRGIDEDMREWSFFMILEHNLIVCRCISAMVEQLANGEELRGAALMNPKTDVMPSASPGMEQVESLREAVNTHLELVQTLGPLRGTRTSNHPIFGAFDAHKWNCMFSFHLGLHLRQATYVCRHAHASVRR